jgi:hypothetical protein
MDAGQFEDHLRRHTESFAKAVADDEGNWIVKGFIDIYRRVFTISVDTKLVSKVLELLLFPMFVEFALTHDLDIQFPPQQNFYPDLTFKSRSSGALFSVDIKSTYRVSDKDVNGMTLGAFTGYFRERTSNKNTLYPYGTYKAHLVLGVIYSQCEGVIDERKTFTLEDLPRIPSVIKDFEFFVQPKYKIAATRPGSGNTKNIGSVTKIDALLGGKGPFADLGEEVYDDYWMYYLTTDMAKSAEVQRPYVNLKAYLDYKERGLAILETHREQITQSAAEEPMDTDGGEPR